MKNSLLQGLLVFLIMFFSGTAFSQSVSGKVTDASGPIPGVSVTEKGTTNSQQTDFDGNFRINNVQANAVLVFSFIGLKTQEIAVGGKSTINVKLSGDQEQLSEVLVIGYGTVKKKDNTGAIETLSSKKFDNIGAANPGELLRGKIAGVQVTSSNGEPGAAISIRIRGNSSLRSGNNPLFVIDGVPLDGGDTSAGGADIVGTSSPKNPLNFLNQNDIESMSILKDAASTAIYGSRGANGVVMITTKKGKSKEPQLNASSSVGFSTYRGNLDVMSSDQYLAAGGVNNGSKYNWKDAILRTAITTNNDVSYSSGTDKSMTRYSFGASNTEGIVKNTGMDKYTASAGNMTSFFNDNLKVDSKITYAGIKDKSTLLSNNADFIGNLIASSLYWNPTNPVYDNSPDGYFNPGYNSATPGSYGADDYLNPVQVLDSYSDNTMTNKLIAYINTTLKLSTNLKYQFLFGVENSTSSRRAQLLPTIRIRDVAQFTVGGTNYYGQADIVNVNRFSKTFEHIFTYDKEFSPNFKLNLVGGYSYYSYDFNQNSMTAKGFAAGQTNLIDNIQGGVTWANGGGRYNFGSRTFRNKVELQSFYARASTNIYKDFNLDFTVRRDGSSKFGVNEKYGTFYAVGAAYKIFSGKEGLVNDLKLRGSFGVTGNQEFAPNSALAVASFANGPGQGFGSIINSNPDLRWETTAASNIGLDFTLLKNRLSGSLEYFFKSTKDLVFAQPAEATQPGPPGLKFVNLPGSLENKGIEASLSYKIIDNENLTWNFDINGSFLQNTVRDFELFVPTAALNGQGLSGAFAQVLTNNQPAYSYYLYEWRGYDATGNSIYADAAGNNTGLGTAAKSVIDKSPLPKMNLGFSTSLSYEKFDASVSFYGAFGHYIYNNTANALFFKGAFPVRNVTEEVATSTQTAGDPNSPSTKYLESGDFLRMGNLTFGYTFSGAFLERAKIKSARFFVNGQNLLLFTNYTGFDPEVDINKTFNGVPSAGIDYLAYPRAKTISLGLNLNF
jgi:iron complex outermembrane receptor protein